MIDSIQQTNDSHRNARSNARPRGRAFLELVGLIGPQLPPSDDPKRTARAIRLMLATGVILSLALAGWVMVDDLRIVTLVWGLFVASCALLAGGGLGFLFGLPSRRNVAIRGPAPAPTSSDPTLSDPTVGGEGSSAQSSSPLASSQSAIDDSTSQDTGYVESTNLERVAEWLTTMIIGLTLTQYGAWEARYFDLSRNVTAAMQVRVCDGSSAAAASRATTRGDAVARIVPKAQGIVAAPATANAAAPTPRKLSPRERDCYKAQAIPGGILMTLFAIIGFLVSYLWMRRYFIFEMVTARQEERQKYLRKLEKDRRDADPVAKAVAERDAAVASAQAAIEAAKAAAAKAQADADAAAAKARADAETQAALVAAEAEAAVAKAKADADVAAAAIAVQLQAANSIVESSPARVPVTGDDLQKIAENTKALAPQIDTVSDSLDIIINQIASKAVTFPDDPWRDRLSSKKNDKQKDNGYLLAAIVKTNDLDANLFDLTITVHADAAAANIGKSVWFLLHPTFGAAPRRTAFDGNGDAVLTLVTYGAFTVGAIMEDGTILELNLAEIEAPQAFRQR